MASCGKPATLAPERDRKRSSCALKINEDAACVSSPDVVGPFVGDKSASVGLDGAFPRRDESTARLTTTGRKKAFPVARLFYFEKPFLSMHCRCR